MACEDQQFPRLLDHGAPRRRTGDSDASAAAELEKSLVAQHAKCTQHRVGIYVEDAARSRAGGNRSPGHASPEARARRISPATWSCSATASVRSTLASIIVLCIVALCIVAVPDETLPPTEVLIPEARRHQRRRYLRTAITAVLAALVVGALVVGAVVLVRVVVGCRGRTGARRAAARPVLCRPVSSVCPE
jgi:hypothetical protein